MEVKKKVAHWSRYHLAALKNYKDNSTPQAIDCSAFVRSYSLYLYEKFESLGSLEFDPALESADAPSKTRQMSADDLCEKFQKLQTTMYRAIGCKPQGTARGNNVVLFAFLMVIMESFKIYRATNDGVLNMLDKFFETDVVVAQQLFDMYKLYLQHADELQDLYSFSKTLAFGSTIDFPKLEQPPESFLETMTEYIDDLRKTGASDKAKQSQPQPAIDSAPDLLNFTEPVPTPAPAAASEVPSSGGFENNASFENNADFLTAPPSSASQDGTPDKSTPTSGGINLDALYGLNTSSSPQQIPTQNAAVFGGAQQMGQQQMAGSPFNGMGMMQQQPQMMQQGGVMQQQPQMMQQGGMMQQQPQMMQQGGMMQAGMMQSGFNTMGMAPAPAMQQGFGGSPGSGMGMMQQPLQAANGGGNPFASAVNSSPSQNNQFNDLFSAQQQQQQKPQSGQSPSFDFLS